MRQNSKEYNELVKRVVPAQTKEYYNKLYLDMIKFIKDDVNGEGMKLRYSHFFSVVWKCQSVGESDDKYESDKD